MYIWRPEVDAGNSRSLCFSTIFSEAGSLSQSQSSRILLVLLANLLWGDPPSLLSEVRITGGTPLSLSIYMDSGGQTSGPHPRTASV